MNTELVKGGQLCVGIKLSRSTHGIKIHAQASPMVEEYMRSLGTGERQLVDAIGRGWIPVDRAVPLQVWTATSQALQNMTHPQFNLSYVGRGLDLSNDLGPNVVNLSFLRLAGISSEAGITFHVKGQVFSLEALRTLKNALGSAARTLYMDFIKPVELSCTLVQYAE